jgi:hypothetical protein
MNPVDSGTTWPEAVLILGLVLAVLLLIGGAAATVLESRKMRVAAGQDADLRQLVGRYEQLAEKTLDAQQRTAADVSELRSRTASVEQILRTVD